MNNRFLINYSPGTTPLHRLNGVSKVLGFLVITVYVIMTFDVRVMMPAHSLSLIQESKQLFWTYTLLGKNS